MIYPKEDAGREQPLSILSKGNIKITVFFEVKSGAQKFFLMREKHQNIGHACPTGQKTHNSGEGSGNPPSIAVWTL